MSVTVPWTCLVFHDLKSLEVYEEGDSPFGEYIAEFAARENVQVEELNFYIYIRKCEQVVEIYKEKGIDINIFYTSIT